MTAAPPATAELGDVRLRHPSEADHATLVAATDAWWGEGARSARPPRWWLRHFARTSWLAEAPDGRVLGFLIGLPSPDQADEAVLLTVAVDPGLRRHGLGRRLVEAFAEALEAGRPRVIATVWPGNPTGIRFLESLGFVASDGPGGQRLYGTPAYADFDGPGEDRAVMVRRSERASG